MGQDGVTIEVIVGPGGAGGQTVGLPPGGQVVTVEAGGAGGHSVGLPPSGH